MKKLQNPSCETCASRLESVFCNLTDEEVASLSIDKRCNLYARGEKIFSEGNRSTSLYCISKGRVKMSKFGSEGKEQIVHLAKSGDVIGYRSVISGEPYSASAIAIEDSRICSIPRSVFHELIHSNSKLSGAIMKLLTDELRSARVKITNLAQKSVMERLAETLLMLKEFYQGGDDSDDINITITITREEIANIVGTATETVIRLLADLRKENILGLNGKTITILDKDSLLKIANVYD